MQSDNWAYAFVGGITVCDTEGIILEMNEQAAKEFESFGGMDLIGSNLLDCHPEPARSSVKKMLSDKKEKIYSVEKQGFKKMVYQTPWYKDGEYAGFVELILPLPMDYPHFVRDVENNKDQSA